MTPFEFYSWLLLAIVLLLVWAVLAFKWWYSGFKGKPIVAAVCGIFGMMLLLATLADAPLSVIDKVPAIEVGDGK